LGIVLADNTTMMQIGQEVVIPHDLFYWPLANVSVNSDAESYVRAPAMKNIGLIESYDIKKD